MSTMVLNEHDANQGAQSKGEFLGMTGNSGWYLLGSAGSTVLMVIVLWGVLEVPLLLCLMVGLVLCTLSVVYVFTLKNNKPDHYDTDFFEGAFVDSGVLETVFGPRERKAREPFRPQADHEANASEASASRTPAARASSGGATFRTTAPLSSAGAARHDQPPAAEETKRAAKPKSDESEPAVPLRTYEKLQVELEMTQEQLADVLSEREEDGPCVSNL